VASHWDFVISLISYAETLWKWLFFSFCKKWLRKDSQLVMLVPKSERFGWCSSF
jgi:hypothetical protein